MANFLGNFVSLTGVLVFYFQNLHPGPISWSVIFTEDIIMYQCYVEFPYFAEFENGTIIR
jgi:hypothetical protein